jgi:peptidyl-prolyl cis-trans isomerase A (cyclophilin A)
MRLLLLPSLLLLALTACKRDQPAETPAAPPPAAGATTAAASPAAAPAAAPAATGWQKAALEGQPLFVTLKTNHGDVVLRLFSKEAPKTVANFVGLASGQKAFKDPATGQTATRPFYDGLTFHRVIPGFMIQGGDPEGSGMGGPGYRFEDEFGGGRTFDRAGLLAMANAGPGTNGSQFFITLGPTPHLTGRHTLFGEVVRGQEVVERIAGVPTDGRDRPREPVVMQKVLVSAEQP